MVKVDSGPERLEIDFLAEAQTLGFIIYPSVPNTIAVTQEADQSYGPFKSKLYKISKPCPMLKSMETFQDLFCHGW